MDADSIRVLDAIPEFDDVIEVDFRVPISPGVDDRRTIIGLYAGLERAKRGIVCNGKRESGAWYLLVHNTATIRTIDVLAVRKLTQATEAV